MHGRVEIIQQGFSVKLMSLIRGAAEVWRSGGLEQLSAQVYKLVAI